MKRVIIQALLINIGTIFICSILWEFVGAVWLLGTPFEPASEKWEHVTVTTFFALLAILYPAWRLLLKNDKLVQSQARIKELNQQLQDKVTEGERLQCNLSLKVAESTQAYHHTQEEYRTLFEYHQAILDHSPIGILKLNPRLEIEYENRTMKRLLGVPDGEESRAMGMRITDIPSVAATNMGPLFERLQEGEQMVAETDFTSIYGRSMTIAYNGVPIREGERVTGFVLLVQDVTIRKQAEIQEKFAREKVEEAYRIKSEFLANMSHEIKTPLTAILGFSQLLGDTSLAEDQRKLQELIHSSSENLHFLLSAILDYSKVERGRVSFAPVTFALGEFLESALAPYRLLARAKGLTFTEEIAHDIPGKVTLDPTRLGQILTNLLDNSLKFTERGEIRFSLRPTTPHDPGSPLIFDVSDTGIGIPKEQIGNIFESFAQVDGSTTRKYGGAGLGATIARTLIELMGGEITVESEVGKGTHFCFTLPATVTTTSA